MCSIVVLVHRKTAATHAIAAYTDIEWLDSKPAGRLETGVCTGS
jgi:hypothetical protein